MLIASILGEEEFARLSRDEIKKLSAVLDREELQNPAIHSALQNAVKKFLPQLRAAAAQTKPTGQK